MNKLCFALLAISLGVSVAAQESSALFGGGDPQAGQGKSATCVACHGQDGNSVNAEWPKLAGQHQPYLIRQLELYKTGGRQNAIMAGMVAGLSAQDMADLAAYYAEQSVQPGVADEDRLALGAEVYRGGDEERGVPACAACHGPRGAGNPLAGYPRVAGQHATYTSMMLKTFRDGAVWGQGDRANSVMAGVAEELTDEEIEAVASYLQGLH